MNAPLLIASLERAVDAIPSMVRGISPADARWKPPDGAWSILEVVRHLGDEEVEDFRARLELTLRDPKAEWTPIAPGEWATDRNYNQGDLQQAVDRFVTERRKSLAWLKGLQSPDWTTMHTRPKFGSMRAGDMLAAWAAHDALHLRQIAKRLYQLTERDAGEFKIAYAGPW